LLVRQSLETRFQTEFKKIRGSFVEVDGEVLKDNIVFPIKWCDAWQVSCSSEVLAKSEGLAPLSKACLKQGAAQRGLFWSWNTNVSPCKRHYNAVLPTVTPYVI